MSNDCISLRAVRLTLASIDYDSDSPSFEEVRMKMTSFNFEYSLGAEIGRYAGL